MKRVLALVGRPNVGKSTLFNRLTKSRDALVANEPGLTRDRRYGNVKAGQGNFIVIDTGGITSDAGIDKLIAEQANQAMEEADAVLFLVDGKEGITIADEAIVKNLRKLQKPVYLIINKTERLDPDLVAADFYAMGLGQPYPIAAEHGSGVSELMDFLDTELDSASAEPEEDIEHTAKVAIVGRPNVGKSTLVNRLLGEERVLAFDLPGTTRDSIFIPFEHNGHPYTLIDTAGVRRRTRVAEKIEKFSVIKALQAIDSCHVVMFVLDAQAEISAQDATLLGYVLDEGKALVIAVNKWDGLSPDKREWIKTEYARKLNFVDFASVHYISALHGSGVGILMDVVHKAYQSSMSDFATPILTRILEDAVISHQPPLIHGRRIKLRYAHQGGKNPPVIVIHGNQTTRVPESYTRYLINIFRKVLKIKGTPLRIVYKGSANPYKEKRTKLTPLQEYKQKKKAQRYGKKK